jgi:hypothetical protein
LLLKGKVFMRRQPLIPYRAYRRYFDRVIKSQRAWRRRQAKLPIEKKIAIIVELQRLNYDIGQAQGKQRPLPWGMIP